MSATEELRHLLDERGVKWHGGDAATYWGDADALESIFRDNALDISLYGITPAQAVEVTLDRGTCHNDAPAYLDFLCSECGFVHYHDDANDNDWHFCPNCGRRTTEEDTQ